MDNFRQSQQSGSVTPSMRGHLNRSFPSSQSIASTASPGMSTPNSWSANEWLRGTPDTSPPSSGVGSPELKAKLPSEDGSVSPVEESIDPTSGPAAKNILVNVVDLNEQRVAAWNSAHLPIHEDGLLKVVRVARDGTLDTAVSLPGLAHPIELKARQPNLVFSTNVVEAIAEADIIFICVNTPTKMQGLGAGSMADVSAVEGATRTVAKHAREGAIIVEKSTVPCGTARMIQDILRHYRPDTSFEVLSNPEFLAEGTAVENLMHPDRILIGSSRSLAGFQAAAVLKDVYAAWVPTRRIVTVNTFSSELAKLVANTMLAQRISSINAVSAMCEEIGLGADVDDVSLAIGKDMRLGPKFLQAGVGFGGSCFEKDILNLAYLARELHLDVVAEYWLAVLKINEDQRQRFARNVVRELNGSLRGKKIAVLGFAFKDGTNDTRNSIAVHIIKDLASEMPREIAVFDPGCAAADILEEIQGIGLSPAQVERVKICSSWRECVQGASAACILTQWKQFRGRQLGNLGATAGKSAKPAGHGLAADGPGADLTEMGIMGLERRTRQEASAPSDDPLGRLRPLIPCPADCSHCGIGAGGMQDQEAVDWVEAAGMMQEPRWVFDGRNVVDHIELQGLGFRVRGIGKGFHAS
ncbi:UDP-glucose/GDP-mannose dehydrogenase family, NAD binding domain-containing protein [Parachaetomium inaequale]|uniref:UDP-glucose 6-dehydrogenase n=1 Tax=Parachaetomium inaequale TaxID=2588326 RepID=A0AAN6P9V4_9PEZI|nr:UDP-glucose/GDP-mannose dehydrogenase family, NAD binding domain-containing protein [Parachaetomium inaequale]